MTLNGVKYSHSSGLYVVIFIYYLSDVGLVGLVLIFS